MLKNMTMTCEDETFKAAHSSFGQKDNNGCRYKDFFEHVKILGYILLVEGNE